MAQKKYGVSLDPGIHRFFVPQSARQIEPQGGREGKQQARDESRSAAREEQARIERRARKRQRDGSHGGAKGGKALPESEQIARRIDAEQQERVAHDDTLSSKSEW